MKNPINQLTEMGSNITSSFLFPTMNYVVDKNKIDPNRTPMKAAFYYWWNNGTYELPKKEVLPMKNIVYYNISSPVEDLWNISQYKSINIDIVNSNYDSISFNVKEIKKNDDDDIDILNIFHQIFATDLNEGIIYPMNDLVYRYGNERGLLVLKEDSLVKHNVNTSYVTLNNTLKCFSPPERFYFTLTSDFDNSMFNAFRTIFGDSGVMLSKESNLFYWLRNEQEEEDFMFDNVLL